MTTFWLKIIAVITMTADHIGSLLSQNSKYVQAQFSISYEDLRATTELLHGIGRLSFPIFAFLLVIGFTHTHDRKKYFSNLMLFGIISQIPFVLLFNNHPDIIDGTKNLFFFDLGDFYLSAFLKSVVFIAVCIFCYYKFVSRKFKDGSMMLLFFALVFTLIDSVKINYVNVLGGTNNIFYTLAFGLYVCYCYEKFTPIQKKPISEYLLLLPLLIFWFTLRMDYGAIGIILILALFAAKKSKPLQAFLIFIWGFLVYNDFQWGYGFHINAWAMVGIIAAAVSVILYNNKKGQNVKWFFYAFYPVHLLALGVINIAWIFGLHNR